MVLALRVGVCIVLCLASASDVGQPELSGGPVIGIDLGTTYSCVGVFRSGRAEILANEQGNRITPSYVAWDPETGERLVGDAAKNQAASNIKGTLFDIKRLIGREMDSDTVRAEAKILPFELVDSESSGRVHVRAEVKQGAPKTFAPEAVSAMVLEKMKSISEKVLGEAEETLLQVSFD